MEEIEEMRNGTPGTAPAEEGAEAPTFAPEESGAEAAAGRMQGGPITRTAAASEAEESSITRTAAANGAGEEGLTTRTAAASGAEESLTTRMAAANEAEESLTTRMAAANAAEERAAAIVEELLAVPLPEGFDVDAAMADTAFTVLLTEYPAAAAVRIYRAERMAEQASRAVADRLRARQGVPASTRPAVPVRPEPDYRAMSDEDFLALKERMARSFR